jgi:microcin C transport system substrate-binding protein
MAVRMTRRNALQGAGALLAAGLMPARAEDAEVHGLSSFGDLALPPDFKRFSYVNPDAPKGGLLSLQITSGSGNQNFETFDTLNTFSRKGDGAAGMSGTFDTLMAGNGDEPSSVYGLLAKSVRVSADKLQYRFRLRPEARFSDGSKLTAADVAFSLTTLKEKAHPIYAILLREMASATAESDEVALVTFEKGRSRDAHLIVAGMPVFSAAWWKGRDFDAATLEAPLGSGPYKVGKFEQGRYIEFVRDEKYWGRDLPVNVGQNNFGVVRYEYYRERQIEFEAFKAGAVNFHQEYTSRTWATGYDFPAVRDKRVVKETLHSGAPSTMQAWYFNLRRPMFKDPRVREAITLCFDFEWTNKNVMYSSYKRVTSRFQNTAMAAVGKPGPEELKLLEPWRGKVPDEVFGEPYLPPVSDGSGSDRTLLKRAYDLLLAAGCKRDGAQMKLPSGEPLAFSFLDSSAIMEPHVAPWRQNMKKLGIDARSRVVDSSQYKSRVDSFDFDLASLNLNGMATPGADLRTLFSSISADAVGSRNLAGVKDPAIDAMVEKAANATTREELTTACRCIDRLWRAGRYWMPAWYNDNVWLGHWDVFSRPERQPKLGVGAPDTWWWDADKAKKIGL